MLLALLLACQRPASPAQVDLTQPSSNCPFSRLLTLTFEEPTSLVGTATDGEHVRSFDRPPATVHELELPGLYADREWTIELTSKTPSEGSVPIDPIVFHTAAVGPNFPEIDVRVRQVQRMEPGLTLLPLTSVGTARYLAVLDDLGELVWLYSVPNERFLEVRLEGDRLLAHHDNEILILDWLGRIYGDWTSSGAEEARGIAIDAQELHHELRRTETGNFLTMTQNPADLPALPSSELVPYELVPTTVVGDELIEVEPETGAIANRWRMVDILDPQRIGYDSLNQLPGGVDWTHVNAVEDDAAANAWVVSVRHQDAVVSFDKTTLEVNWIAGNHANWHEPWASALLEPVGDDPGWFWHQHGIKWRPEDGNLLLFDNGNHRAAPFTPDVPLSGGATWSRVAEYHIDQQARTIERTWTFDLDPAVYSSAMGDADHLPNGNVLATYAFVFWEGHVSNPELGRSSPSLRVVEIDPKSNEVVWDLDAWGPDTPHTPWQTFRSTRIPSFDVEE